MTRSLICALVAALALFAVADAKLELTQEHHAILHNHILNLKSTGEHLKEEIPDVIRGENMTVQNLHKYFDADLKMEVRLDGKLVDPADVPAEVLVPPTDEEVAEAAADKINIVKKSSSRKMLQSPEEIEQLIKIGKEIWKVVEDNAPVLNYQLTAQSASVPKGCQDNWMSMAGFKDHQTYTVSWHWTNGFGMSVVEFDFVWQFKSDGTCKVGSDAPFGKFLKGAGVAAKNVHVSWGYTCNVVGRTFEPYNVGTHDQPVAAFDMEVEMRHSTILVDNVQACRVNVKGSGGFRAIHCDLYDGYIRLKY